MEHAATPGPYPTPGSIPSTGRVIQAGKLPPWEELTELPAPPPYSLKNAFRVAGAGAIVLGGAIGSGEWLIGPAVTAQFTAALLWVATISILLQWVFNEEACRYTLYTGEPIFSGFMRTKPGAAFWGWFYSVLGFIQLGWPGWAAAAATAIVAALIGGTPGPEHAGQVLFWGYVTFFASLVLLLLGRKVEQALEYAEWFMVIWIIAALLFLGLFFTSLSTWITVITGFLGGGLYYIRSPQTGELMGLIPSGADWLILAGFAAYAGAGGLGNCTITNWVRDKGMGMGSQVGYIPAAVGGGEVKLEAHGKVFEPTPENASRFREWMKYIRFDQGWVFTLGCFIGMGLPALLTVQFIPPGTQVGGMAVAVRQAEGISNAFGGLSTHPRPGPLVPHAADRVLDPLQHPAQHHGPVPAHRHRHPLDQQSRRPQLGEGRRPEDLLLGARHLRRLGLHRHQPGPAVHPDHPRRVHGRPADVDLRRPRLVRQPHVPAEGDPGAGLAAVDAARCSAPSSASSR